MESLWLYEQLVGHLDNPTIWELSLQYIQNYISNESKNVLTYFFLAYLFIGSENLCIRYLKT